MRLGKKVSWLTVMSLGSILVFLLSACGGTSTATGQKPAPASQQVLRAGIVIDSTDITTMDPALITDFYSFQMAELVYPGLVTLNNNLQIVPWAAASMPTVSDGGLTYTFKLRSGMTWSDGTPIDANTFAYTFNRSLDPCVNDGAPSGAASYLYTIKGGAAFNGSTCDAKAGAANPTDSKSLIGTSIVVQDPTTLVIHLEKPYAYFLDTLVTDVALAQPQQLITQYGLKNWTNHLTDNGGFTGNLFKVASWDHKGHMDFSAWSGTWASPKPTLQTVDFTFYKTGETGYSDYLNGQLDAFWTIPASQFQAASKRADFHQYPYLAEGYIQPNWAKAPFNNVLARKAFAVAIDKTALVAIAHNSAIATNHIVPKGDPGYDANLTGPDGTTSVSGNTTMAGQLIQQYANAACGGQVSKCTPVTYMTDNTTAALANTQALLAQWKQAMPGYPITVKNVDFGTLLGQVYGPPSGVPQIFGIGWTLDYPDPEDWLSLQFLPGSSVNVGGVNDSAANTLMNEADVEQNQATRFSEYNKAEQILVNDVAWIPLDQQIATYVATSKVADYQQNSAGYTMLQTWQKAFIAQ